MYRSVAALLTAQQIAFSLAVQELQLLPLSGSNSIAMRCRLVYDTPVSKRVGFGVQGAMNRVCLASLRRFVAPPFHLTYHLISLTNSSHPITLVSSLTISLERSRGAHRARQEEIMKMVSRKRFNSTPLEVCCEKRATYDKEKSRKGSISCNEPQLLG